MSQYSNGQHFSSRTIAYLDVKKEICLVFFLLSLSSHRLKTVEKHRRGILGGEATLIYSPLIAISSGDETKPSPCTIEAFLILAVRVFQRWHWRGRATLPWLVTIREWPMCSVWQPFFSDAFLRHAELDAILTSFCSNGKGETDSFFCVVLAPWTQVWTAIRFTVNRYLYRLRMNYENGPPMIKSPSSSTSDHTTLWYMLGVAPFQWETGNFLCLGSKISTKTSICLRYSQQAILQGSDLAQPLECHKDFQAHIILRKNTLW